jgi:hypothetical protein
MKLSVCFWEIPIFKPRTPIIYRKRIVTIFFDKDDSYEKITFTCFINAVLWICLAGAKPTDRGI